MSTVLKLYGGDPGAVAADAAALLENLSGQAPEIAEEADDGLRQNNLAAVIWFATLVLTLSVSASQHLGRIALRYFSWYEELCG